jgi:hypothetical protein
MPTLLTGAKIASLTHGLISAKKQEHGFSLDLTARKIERIDKAGALDFGGSEYSEASATLITPEKKTSSDNYGWWKLGPASYFVYFNEKLGIEKSSVLLVVPHERLVRAGASHAELLLDRLDENTRALLVVSVIGLEIKENARLSRAIVVVDEDDSGRA